MELRWLSARGNEVMRRYLVAAACVGSLVLALLVAFVIHQHRCQVAQAQEAAAAQSRAQAQLDALMRHLRERDAGRSDASKKLISDPGLGDYPPPPPWGPPGQLPSRRTPAPGERGYGPGDNPVNGRP